MKDAPQLDGFGAVAAFWNQAVRGHRPRCRCRACGQTRQLARVGSAVALGVTVAGIVQNGIDNASRLGPTMPAGMPPLKTGLEREPAPVVTVDGVEVEARWVESGSGRDER